VSKNSDLRITWSGPESDDKLFGFPVVERELEPVYEKCRQLQGTVIPVRQPVRFAGPSSKRDGSGPKPDFVRSVTTEIHCKQADQFLWVAKIAYSDHRFYQDIQNRERIQLQLRTSYIAGESLNLPQDEESKRRRAEALAARQQRDEEALAQSEQRRRAEAQAKQEQAQIKKAQRAAELPAFRAQLKAGDRVGVLSSQGWDVVAKGLVIEVKQSLVQVQFRPEATMLNPAPRIETLWFPTDQLVQPD